MLYRIDDAILDPGGNVAFVGKCALHVIVLESGAVGDKRNASLRVEQRVVSVVQVSVIKSKTVR